MSRNKRASSPAASEPDLDFADTLLAGNSADDSLDGGFFSNLAPATKESGRRKTSNAASLSDAEFIEAAQAASNRKASSKNGQRAGVKSSGSGFQAMGLLPSLTKAITHKGFKVPTPIQRKTMPLILDGRDVVGMARTGSGKTAAFVIPLIQRLKTHTARQGVRGVIMSPSRELALQTLKVVKELSKGTDLRSVLLVGGDSLEEHFASMSGNPDIVVATPGRFLHIKVEMGLNLSTVEYIVFDEADRLFEMGFAAQLTEILHALPPTRQSLLFSATLPVSLVEFAKAGLQEPVLVRLDADSKISPELESAFISVQTTDKEGVLLYLLSDVIRLASAQQMANSSPDNRTVGSTGKNWQHRQERVAENATIIFACTKHHVEYLATLLRQAGYLVSYVYGALDQTARRLQVDAFKSGRTNILVVTDVAARGVDIPILANVINYDFPAQPKVFVHRVGRTARAGKRGWSYSLVRAEDAPYLLDLQLFLARRLVTANLDLKGEQVDYTKDIVLGALPRDGFDRSGEWVTKLMSDSTDLASQKRVALKGEKLYLRTRPAASADSVRRAKDLVRSSEWVEVTPLLANTVAEADNARLDMLKRVGSFRPNETVFEIGSRGANPAASVMRTRRHKLVIDPAKSRPSLPDVSQPEPTASSQTAETAPDYLIDETFAHGSKKRKRGGMADFRDTSYMSHYDPTADAADHAYDISRGDSATRHSFAAQARTAQLDLATDEGKDARANQAGAGTGGKRWDPRKKKFVNTANDYDGSKALPDVSMAAGKNGSTRGKRFVTGESGVKIPASYKAGRYDAWKRSAKATRQQLGSGTNVDKVDARNSKRAKFSHKQDKMPRLPDRFRDDFEKQKAKYDKASERRQGVTQSAATQRSKNVRSELKTAADIRKDRILKQKRRDKNARPAQKPRRR
ncbi:ATP-dependent RNA helicase dbp10 [Savitreella phatthalungensis]